MDDDFSPDLNLLGREFYEQFSGVRPHFLSPIEGDILSDLALGRSIPEIARLRGLRAESVHVLAKHIRDKIVHYSWTSPEPPDLPDIAIIWHPEFVSDDEYAELVEILGDLVRANGGGGVRRIIEEEMGIDVGVLQS